MHSNLLKYVCQLSVYKLYETKNSNFKLIKYVSSAREIPFTLTVQ